MVLSKTRIFKHIFWLIYEMEFWKLVRMMENEICCWDWSNLIQRDHFSFFDQSFTRGGRERERERLKKILSHGINYDKVDEVGRCFLSVQFFLDTCIVKGKTFENGYGIIQCSKKKCALLKWGSWDVWYEYHFYAKQVIFLWVVQVICDTISFFFPFSFLFLVWLRDF